MEDELIGIEDKFRMSWDAIHKEFCGYVEAGVSILQPMVDFICELRAEGYDEWFRARPVTTLMFISRSIKPYSHNHECCVRFYVSSANSMDVQGQIRGRLYKITLSPIAITSELKVLLELLMAQPIE